MGKVASEKRTVEYMIGLYCRKNHQYKTLCADCMALKEYAFKRLDKCSFGDEKGTCKGCKVHCYNSQMREKIRTVMRFSGPRMIIYYPLDFVKHMIQKSL